MTLKAKIFAVTGYQFNDPQLLKEALTHSSLTTSNNEKLEFLGDRVLGLVLADMLIKHFPLEKEGDLALRYADLSSSSVLSEIALQTGINDLIAISLSEENTGGRYNASILADSCEALIGAIYLEGGLEPAQAFIKRYWQVLMQEKINPPKDAKSFVQEWAQSKGYGLPEYKVIDKTGPDHNPLFVVELKVGDLKEVIGEGNSKKNAEQTAAKNMLEVIS